MDLLILECNESLHLLQSVNKETLFVWEQGIHMLVKEQKLRLLSISEAFQKTLQKIKARSQIVVQHKQRLDEYMVARGDKQSTLFSDNSDYQKEDQFIVETKGLLDAYRNSGTVQELLSLLKSQFFGSGTLQVLNNRLIVAIDIHQNSGQLKTLSARHKFILLSNYPEFALIYKSIDEMKNYAEFLITNSEDKGQVFLDFALLLENKLNAFLTKIGDASVLDIQEFQSTFKAYIHSQDDIKEDRNYLTFFDKLKGVEKMNAVSEVFEKYSGAQ